MYKIYILLYALSLENIYYLSIAVFINVRSFSISFEDLA